MCPSYLDGDLVIRLTSKHAVVIPVTLEKLYSFQGPRTQTTSSSGTSKRRRPDWPPVSQNSTACKPPTLTDARLRPHSVDIARTWPHIETALCSSRRFRRSNPGGFPRKEVIQPHLPVRLPCYDFTPVTSPTFDGSLPKGLGHRLRVLLASVV